MFIINTIETMNNAIVTVHHFIFTFFNNRSITKNRIAVIRPNSLNSPPKKQCAKKDTISLVRVDLKIFLHTKSLMREVITPYVTTSIKSI